MSLPSAPLRELASELPISVSLPLVPSTFSMLDIGVAGGVAARADARRQVHNDRRRRTVVGRGIHARPAGEVVGAARTVQRVVAVPPFSVSLPLPPSRVSLPPSPEQGVVAAETPQRIVAVAAVQAVGGVVAEDDVAPVAASGVLDGGREVDADVVDLTADRGPAARRQVDGLVVGISRGVQRIDAARIVDR